MGRLSAAVLILGVGCQGRPSARAPAPIVLAEPAASTAEPVASAPPPTPEPVPVEAEAFELFAIDDGADPFVGVTGKLPRGISLANEDTQLGPDKSGNVRHARLEPLAGESPAQTLERGKKWLAELPLPAGARFAFEPEPAPIAGTYELGVLFRTYLVSGERVLGPADLVSAELVKEPEYSYVRIKLTGESAGRLEQLTKAHYKRRVAILLYGEVQSAAVIVSIISEGELSMVVLMDRERQRVTVERFLARFGGAKK